MFNPWIGKDYLAQSAPKIMILGESHYGEFHIKTDSPPEDRTVVCIQKQIDESWKARFYTKIASMLIGHRPTIEEKRSFWHSVVYHNLITEPLEKHRVPPTTAQWDKSIPTLAPLIKELKPDYCICLGYRMWERLKTYPGFTLIPFDSDIGSCGAYWSEELNCIFHGVMHPSGRGSRSFDWNRYINNIRETKWGDKRDADITNQKT